MICRSFSLFLQHAIIALCGIIMAQRLIVILYFEPFTLRLWRFEIAHCYNKCHCRQVVTKFFAKQLQSLLYSIINGFGRHIEYFGYFLVAFALKAMQKECITIGFGQ